MKTLFFAIFTLLSLPLFAQDNDRIWLRTTLSYKDVNAITYDLEFQNRFQNLESKEFPQKTFFKFCSTLDAL